MKRTMEFFARPVTIVTAPHSTPAQLLTFLLAILWAAAACGSDYVFVVDTSSTMTERVSRADTSIRIQKVQSALNNYFQRLPIDSRVYLISFNTGVLSEREHYIRNDSDRQFIFSWIDGLAQEASKGGRTFLCSTLRKAFQKASEYAAEHPGQPVKIWALTDGMDNENGPENETSKRLNEVLDEFPNIDENSVQADLVILGDRAFTITSKKPWFRASHDAKFENIVPPLIQWSPENPKAGESITFFENSPTPYQFYDWRIDGVQAGATKVVKRSFPAAGTHTIRLVVTAANGDKLPDTKTIFVHPADRPPKPTADFVVIPSAPEPSEKVQFIGRSKGKATRFAWFVNGQLLANEELTETAFPEEGRFEVRFRVEDESGASDEKTRGVMVKEQALHVRFSAITESTSGQPVQFANETSGGGAARFDWDFGDGARSTNTNPVHAFQISGATPREFIVSLRAKSRLGKSYSAEPFRLKVHPSPPKPKAAFRVSSDRVRVGAIILFLNDSTGLVEQTTWTFGREGTSTNTTPEFAFSSPGEKDVVLTVSGPGGTDSATNRVFVMKPELVISLNWIDAQGQNSAAPQSVAFDDVPLAHAKNGEYRRPPYDSFDAVMPPDMPADGGLAVSFGEKGAKGLELVRHLPDSEKLVPITGLVRETGRYRIRVQPDAAEGDYSDIANFGGKGANVLLGGPTNVLAIPVTLRVGTPGPGPMFWLFILMLMGLVALLLKRAMKHAPIVPANKPMEVVLQEISMGADGKPTPTQTLPSKTVILSRNQRIHLGASPGLALTDHVFDLGMPLGFLLRQEKGLLLHRSTGGKDEILSRNGEFTVTDGKEKKRIVRLTMRAAADTKPGNPRPHK